MSDKPWIKIYNEVDSDCILGNQQGLTSLRDAIDYTLDNRIYSVEENFQADFKSIILVDKNCNNLSRKNYRFGRVRYWS